MDGKVLSLSVQNVPKLRLQEGRVGTVLEPPQQYNFLIFHVIIAMYYLSLYRKPVSYSSPSSLPSSLSLHAVDSNVRMPSNLMIPNQCSRFSSGCSMDLCITIFSLVLYFEFHSFFPPFVKFSVIFWPYV